MRRCRRCSEEFEPARDHFHTCPGCWQPAPAQRIVQRVRQSPSAKLASLPGQMSIYDALPEEPEFSAYIAYEDARQRGTAIAA
jgi:hypothetical protein